MVKLECVLYALLVLFPLTTQRHEADAWSATSTRNDVEALNILRTIKRRVSSQMKAQVRELSRSEHRSIKALATVKRRQRPTCRNWNDACIPWSSEADEMCCNQRHLVCRCNLWMQNCRCVSRGWGK